MSSVEEEAAAQVLCPVFVARWRKTSNFPSRGLTGSCNVLQPRLVFLPVI